MIRLDHQLTPWLLLPWARPVNRKGNVLGQVETGVAKTLSPVSCRGDQRPARFFPQKTLQLFPLTMRKESSAAVVHHRRAALSPCHIEDVADALQYRESDDDDLRLGRHPPVARIGIAVSRGDAGDKRPVTVGISRRSACLAAQGGLDLVTRPLPAVVKSLRGRTLPRHLGGTLPVPDGEDAAAQAVGRVAEVRVTPVDT